MKTDVTALPIKKFAMQLSRQDSSRREQDPEEASIHQAVESYVEPATREVRT